MFIPILYEDDQLIVIDKPPGVVVNRAESVQGETVADWADEKIKEQIEKSKNANDKDFLDRSGIVHRLDKDTSGILLVAKTFQSFTNLQKQFADRVIQKKYTALVHGKPPAKTGAITVPVARLPWNRERFGVAVEGKEASTSFKTITVYADEKTKEMYTLLSLSPHTGRTHQIRVHLKYLGLPIVSDEFYAGRKRLRRDREWCSRLFLHAAAITFSHPLSGKPTTIESPLPLDLAEALSKLSPL